MASPSIVDLISPTTATPGGGNRVVVRVAVLYTGRWFYPANKPWVESHLRHLIAPANADVILSATMESFCSPSLDSLPVAAAERQLETEVREAFGKHVLAVRLVPEPEPKTIRGMMRVLRAAVLRTNASLDAASYANSAFKTSSMYSWRKQSAKAAVVEMLRRATLRTHDVIVRTRIDMMIHCTLPVISLHPLARKTVYAVRRPVANTTALGGFGASVNVDWLYVTDEDGMAAMADMGNQSGSLMFSASTRCFGFCPEEQTQLQLKARGVSMASLPDPPWRTEVQRARDLLALRYSSAREFAKLKLTLADLGLRMGCRIGYDLASMKAAPPWSRQQSQQQQQACNHSRITVGV